jgi:pseudouridine-5'-phosphate glycosidase
MAAVHTAGATPAVIAVWNGRPTVGLTDDELLQMARRPGLTKAARRDLPAAIALGHTAGTTVSATMFLAHQAGIRVFATGGIGGVHSPGGWDVSADLTELARTTVAVVCAGAKNVLDIPATLEALETLSVPVVGYQTQEFPGFFTRSSGESISTRVETPEQAADLLLAHWNLKGAGVVVAQSAPAEAALDATEMTAALKQAQADAVAGNIHGAALTPFLLGRLAVLTHGKTLHANQALVVANAGLAARIAKALAQSGSSP